MRHTFGLLIMAVILLCSSPTTLSVEYQKVRLLPGHSEVLQVVGVEKIAVGNPDIIQAKLLDASHLLINAVGIGSTNLLLMGDNEIQRISIDVSAWMLRDVQDFCKYLLGPDVKVVEINGQVFVSGMVEGEPNYLTQAITQRFPGVGVRLKAPETTLNTEQVNTAIRESFQNQTFVFEMLTNDIGVITGQASSFEEYARVQELIHTLPFPVANLVKSLQEPDNSDQEWVRSLNCLLSSIWPNLEYLTQGEFLAIRGCLPSEEYLVYQEIISQHAQDGKILSLVKQGTSDSSSPQGRKMQQIRVRLHLLELNRQDLSELGFDWDNSVAFKAENSKNGIFQIGSFIRDGDLVSRLRLLSSKGKVRVLAEPELTTVEGQEARIHVGGEIPVGNGEGIEWKEYGIQFTITPELTTNQDVQIQIKAEVSSLDWTNMIELGDVVLPAISSSSFSTMLRQPSGSSTALGGILERRVGRTQNGIPGLTSLPVLGELFSWNKTEITERELVAIVSAYLANDEPISSQEEKGDSNSVKDGGAELLNDVGI